MSKVDVLGVQIDALTREELLHTLKNILTYKQVFITTPYSEMVVAAQKDEQFRTILNSADFALADGIGVLWAAHFLKHETYNTKQVSGFRFQVLWKLLISLSSIIFDPRSIRDPIPEKISGSEFVWDLAQLAEQKNYSVFLLGGVGDTPRRAGERLKQRFPNLRIAGTYSPNFNHCHCEAAGPKQSQHSGDCFSSLAMTEKINSSSADLLFVALGPVRQEKWIYKNLPKIRVKLAIGLGGTFDYLAIKRPLAPKFWAQRGLEWLWRLITQPWRIGRISKGTFGLIYYTIKADPRGNQFRGGGI
ncbi:MAG: WecB/TagA/CpsF family glycosyltransferase [bacterium]|nr:WecB/TagA/CpsF family glycosyltransferase [bacterium]